LDQIAHVGGQYDYVSRYLSYSAVKLFSKYSNLCENHTSKSQTDFEVCIISLTLFTSLHLYMSVPQRVQFKLAVTVHRSFRHRAPAYLADYCVPVSTVSGRHHLRSARRHQLSVPRVQRSTFGTRAFSVSLELTA